MGVRPEVVRILSPGVQRHLLLVAVGAEQDVVLDDERSVHATGPQRGLHEDVDAIPAGNLHIAEAQARAAVHIDPERGWGTAFQHNVHPHALAVPVAGGEALGHRAHRGEHCIEQYRILGELQLRARRIGKELVLAATEEDGGQQDEQEGGAEDLQSRAKMGRGAITG